MLVKNIAGMKLEQAIQAKIIPKGLSWIGNKPISYSINVMRNISDTKTIIVLTDSFGGGISFATTPEVLELKSLGREIEQSELDFIKKNYPQLHYEIYNF